MAITTTIWDPMLKVGNGAADYFGSLSRTDLAQSGYY